MERFIVILFSVLLGVVFFIWFSRAINKQPLRDYISNNLWLLHPNAICYWRTAMALIGLVLYFFLGYENIGIVIFTFAAILDGVDGIVARKCKLGSKFGEWLDPFCDKFTYLPPLIGFAYRGIISVKLIWVMVAIELFGQFFARRILDLLKTSGAANNFGKIKAIICFGLVIFCALLDAIPDIPDIYNISDEVLAACIILATASIVFKFIPNYVYADILSTLNFCCGIVSLVLTHHYYFVYAICVIIMGQLFDLFDGRMAEKHGGTKFGPYMDDIADFVSFGLAPAYVIIKSGGSAAWLFAAVYVAGVGFRLIRFVAVDKKRTDLPEGIFNGLPSPAGALIVLGGALAVDSSPLLWLFAVVSVGLMVSHLRFAHFGRIMITTIPRPVFFLMCSFMVVTISFVLRTQNVHMFGYLILASVTLYMLIGRNMVGVPNAP
ncbi:MAG: CDP-alcohol phosphatidyltransferase family protein [Desulfofustis sp.]|nr:CDP-alcohol phosphatidyltransferase family protein [Desulfofustis sp.]NNK57527.1 phosphatidylserine synthase [Desulfofustis sp.]RZW25016.1 MAG: phosphatidylserine synthase [Desulfobulbaceae bacterium]